MATTSSPPTGVSNGELIRWAFDRLNERDVTPLRPFWSAETVERFPDATCRGSDEIAAYFEGVFAALPDFHMRVESLAEQGDDVFVHWHLTGTHSGAPFSGIAATGRPVAIDGIDHFVLRDGTVVSNFVVFDQMQFARQIGLLPEDGSAGDRAMKAAFNGKTELVRRVRERTAR
jgi:predicted ester cyclase